MASKFSRKFFLKSGLLSGGLAMLGSMFTGNSNSGGSPALQDDYPKGDNNSPKMPHSQEPHGGMTTVGRVNHKRNGFDPHKLLTDWDTGEVSTLSNGQTLREYEIVAQDREIEIAPGIKFPAWTYNGRVPGPTIRCTEGDRLRIHFINAGSHPHTIHFHGIHSAQMDGIPATGPGMIKPTESFTYEFDAYPYGCHLYHCHATPLKRHIHKGLYGAFIVDPDPDQHPEHREVAASRRLGSEANSRWQEYVMVMNGFDTNFDEENEVYAANSIAFAYMNKPIKIYRERPVRVYLVNVTEFDPINSFHLHANFFNYFDHGTTLEPTQRNIDTVMLCQAQRGILEFSFDGFEPGKYMFHAHQSEFAELGWMSLFDVVSEEVPS